MVQLVNSFINSLGARRNEELVIVVDQRKVETVY